MSPLIPANRQRLRRVAEAEAQEEQEQAYVSPRPREEANVRRVQEEEEEEVDTRRREGNLATFEQLAEESEKQRREVQQHRSVEEGVKEPFNLDFYMDQ